MNCLSILSLCSSADDANDGRPVHLTDDVLNTFIPPIGYTENYRVVSDTLARDVELYELDGSNTAPHEKPAIYHLFAISPGDLSDIGQAVVKQWAGLYTSNVVFLREQQQLLAKLSDDTASLPPPPPPVPIEEWSSIRHPSLIERHAYAEWKSLEFLNKSEPYLFGRSMMSFASPILTLLSPLIMLIAPFIVLLAFGHVMPYSDYWSILRSMSDNNAIIRLFFTSFSRLSWTDAVYLFLSVALYVYSIYCNVMDCIYFYRTQIEIRGQFEALRAHTAFVKRAAKSYKVIATSLSTQRPFCDVMERHLDTIERLSGQLEKLTPYSLWGVRSYFDMGKNMRLLYELHTQEEYHSALCWSMGFSEYYRCMVGLSRQWKAGAVHSATFGGESLEEADQLCSAVHPSLAHSGATPNDISLQKNMIITGPNAAGKTTILKTVLLNVLFTQQFGLGFYGADTHLARPFDHLHSYLNIPDTSARDSLFQAEARRAKDILTAIRATPSERHLCVLDEIFSGTNPEEATQSATAFVSYLAEQHGDQVVFLLTTHFLGICDAIEKKSLAGIVNRCMETVVSDDNKWTFTYRIVDGVSSLKGGVRVLREMDYPVELTGDDGAAEKSEL